MSAFKEGPAVGIPAEAPKSSDDRRPGLLAGVARRLEIKAVDGKSGEILRSLRLKVLAQATEVLSDLEKCERGLVIGAVNADDHLLEFLKPRIGGSQLAAQFPVLFERQRDGGLGTHAKPSEAEFMSTVVVTPPA